MHCWLLRLPGGCGRALPTSKADVILRSTLAACAGELACLGLPPLGFAVVIRSLMGLIRSRLTGMFISTNTVPDMLDESNALAFEVKGVTFDQAVGLTQSAVMQGNATEVQLFSYMKLNETDFTLTSSVYCFGRGMEKTNGTADYTVSNFDVTQPNIFSVARLENTQELTFYLNGALSHTMDISSVCGSSGITASDRKNIILSVTPTPTQVTRAVCEPASFRVETVDAFELIAVDTPGSTSNLTPGPTTSPTQGSHSPKRSPSEATGVMRIISKTTRKIGFAGII